MNHITKSVMETQISSELQRINQEQVGQEEKVMNTTYKARRMAQHEVEHTPHLEICNGIKSVNYLYKYVYKGVDNCVSADMQSCNSIKYLYKYVHNGVDQESRNPQPRDENSNS